MTRTKPLTFKVTNPEPGVVLVALLGIGALVVGGFALTGLAVMLLVGVLHAHKLLSGTLGFAPSVVVGALVRVVTSPIHSFSKSRASAK